MTSPRARPARMDDAKGMGVALGNAFGDDPVFEYIAPKPDVTERCRRLAPFFAAESRTKVRSVSAWTTDDHAGAALWAPPGKWKTPMLASVGMALPFLRLASTGMRRGLRLLARVEDAHPHDPPHWYLATLGTDPSHQGTGVGSAVMQPVLDTCDTEVVPAYLESSKESNIPFYERHGFRVTGEIVVPGGPTLWAMWRDPVSRP